MKRLTFSGLVHPNGSPSLGDVTSERPLQLVANRSLAALQLGESLERCATV